VPDFDRKNFCTILIYNTIYTIVFYTNDCRICYTNDFIQCYTIDLHIRIKSPSHIFEHEICKFRPNSVRMQKFEQIQSHCKKIIRTKSFCRFSTISSFDHSNTLGFDQSLRSKGAPPPFILPLKNSFYIKMLIKKMENQIQHFTGPQSIRCCRLEPVIGSSIVLLVLALHRQNLAELLYM
jgi:hypothetical protein